MARPTNAYINIAALQHNLARVRALAPTQSVLAMIKSNGYGHGVAHVAKALTSADAFGVASIGEAIELRKNNFHHEIFLMEGFFSSDELSTIQQENFSVIIHHEWQIKILEQHPPTTPIKVWLKIDTGMHRLGVSPQEFFSLWQRLQKLNCIEKPIGLMTHFADADDIKKSSVQKQIQCYTELTQNLLGPRSLANSAAILGMSHTHADWVRPGIMLYGASPFASDIGLDHDLKPVMTLTSEIISIRQCDKGDAIGYGGTFICPQDMLVGVVAIGYGDGYPRHAPTGTPTLVNNKIAPLIGRVSMDMITVDLSQHLSAKIGDPVVLWGNGLAIEIIARHAGTISYELLCGVTARVCKIYC